MNFKNFGYTAPTENSYSSGGRLLGDFPLTKQLSIYSLTIDELQSTLGGGMEKDFGSMNMDELLKNIWSAEETQPMVSCSTAAAQQGCGNSGVYLQKQGSLTLPRTLSQKTVEEVWRDLSKVDDLGKGGNGGVLFNDIPQRQQTLGEMTLEEFLYKAGVVREDNHFTEKTNNGGFFGNGNCLGIDFQKPDSNKLLVGNRIADTNSQMSILSSNLPLNVNGVRTNHQQQKIFPKQPTVTYGQLPLSSSGAQWENPREAIANFADHGLNSAASQMSTVQSGGAGVIGLKGGHVNVERVSPGNQVLSDGIRKSNGDISSISSVPYMFNGGARGRRSSGTVEKAAERRHKRMIKNRESAARSRARKQAYTTELEAEVANLKEENGALQKKQEAIMEIQKNQELQITNMLRGGKRIRLRRTQTGPCNVNMPTKRLKHSDELIGVAGHIGSKMKSPGLNEVSSDDSQLICTDRPDNNSTYSIRDDQHEVQLQELVVEEYSPRLLSTGLRGREKLFIGGSS